MNKWDIAADRGAKVSRGGTALGGILAACLIGTWLRLDQFLWQVVTDDEWHALHQVIFNSPRQFLLSFGTADYSIPLTLLYWCEARWFGLTELAMRWPMMAAGLAVLVLFPLWAARQLGWRTALVFALLLAVSPMLIYYSRNARPYGLTLLLGYLAHYCFWRYWASEQRLTFAAVGYAVCAALSVWLHLLTLPFVTAPFLLAATQLMRPGPERATTLKKLLLLGVPAALLMALAVLPPLIADTAALTGKSGADQPNLDTWVGLGHLWLGTPLAYSMVACAGLALLGLPAVWRAGSLPRGAITGVAITLALIYMAQPAWVHNPLTLGRYLLPGIVLLLLAVASGAARAATAVDLAFGRVAAIAVLLLPVAILLPKTPLGQTMTHPNSYSLHSMYQFDYREERAAIRDKMVATIPLSPWWRTLADRPRQTLTIAVAPYSYFSPRWDAPRWEALGHQRVIPGFVTGLCAERRDGETPRDSRFALRNAVHLADGNDLRRKNVAFVVFQKPYSIAGPDGQRLIGQDDAHCLPALAAQFGKPIFEDDKISVFRPYPAAAHDQQ